MDEVSIPPKDSGNENAETTDVIAPMDIRPLIYAVRGRHVIFDRDLAMLYGVPTKALNQAVKRNANRFPNRFMFRLDDTEMSELVTNCDRFENERRSQMKLSLFMKTENPAWRRSRSTK